MFAGHEFRRGDSVAGFLTAANRDPALFENPHQFDITRHPNPHLSFGTKAPGAMRNAVDTSLKQQPIATLAIAGALGFLLGALWKS